MFVTTSKKCIYNNIAQQGIPAFRQVGLLCMASPVRYPLASADARVPLVVIKTTTE